MVMVHVTYQSLSDGGGGIFRTSIPARPFTSTVSISLVFDTPSIAFFMYLFSVA